MCKAIVWLSVLCLISCKIPSDPKTKGKEDTKQESAYNATQRKFISLLATYDASIMNTQYRVREFPQQLVKFIDSSRVFVNWKGKIENLEVYDVNRNGRAYKSVSMTIGLREPQYKPYSTITFRYNNLFDLSKKNENRVLRQISKLVDVANVYFDGFIVTKKGRIPYYQCSNHSYDFTLLSITDYARTDTLSVALKEKIALNYQICVQSQKQFRGKMSKSEFNKWMSSQTERANKLTTQLTEEEKQYQNDWFNAKLHEMLY